MSKSTQKANPMKPAPETPEPEENTITFESEEVQDLAGEADAAGKISLGDIVGTGEDGVITLDDVEAAIEAHEPPADDNESSENTVDFASDEAGEYAFQLNNDGELSTEAVSQIKGTGKNGAITKGDINKALKAIAAEKAEAEAEAKAEKAEAEAEAKAEKAEAEEDGERELDLTDPKDLVLLNSQVLDGLISFASPVRGALNTKPAVQETWNELISKVTKLKKAIVAMERKA